MERLWIVRTTVTDRSFWSEELESSANAGIFLLSKWLLVFVLSRCVDSFAHVMKELIVLVAMLWLVDREAGLKGSNNLLENRCFTKNSTNGRTALPFYFFSLRATLSLQRIRSWF